ncbi:hypothetical protein BH09VER1_BH09VER1_30750 [soil metagenome]
MTPEREDLIYQDILRAVIWGAEKDDVFHTLKVNDITGERAEELYQSARKERIDMLRSEGTRKAITGTLLLLAGTAMFCIFYSMGVILIGVGAFVWGAWRLISGAVEFVIAPTKKGSAVAD